MDESRLDQLADTPEFRAFVARKFPGHASDLLESPSRREFLRLMGASLALAGLTACRWPEENIAPFANRPEGRTPGVPLFYASTVEMGGAARGVLVESSDGRPIKIEGNPSHPQSLGATDAMTQAAVLELYDPDRLNRIVRVADSNESSQTWDDLILFCKERFSPLRQNGGQGFRVLSEASSSPSFAEMRARLLAAFPKAVWHEYEPISTDNERAGACLAFGKPLRTHLALENADVIVCLDADVLMTHPAAIPYARAFAAGRRADNGRMNRLYAVESVYSITGALADHRLPALSKNVAAVACRLAAELHKQGLPLPPADPKLIQVFQQAGDAPVDGQFITAMARDLMRARARGVVVAGPRQPAEVHALAHLLNAALGAVGTTVRYTEEPDPDRPTHVESIRDLAAAMDRGEVNTLLILGGNPAFDAPADLEFGRGLAKVEAAIHLTLYSNETSQICQWRLPRAHWLESWGDARSHDGTISFVQPLIDPLYAGKTPIEILALILTGDNVKGFDVVRETFGQKGSPPTFETWWRQALHDGLVPGTQWPSVNPGALKTDWSKALGRLIQQASEPEDGSVELVFCPDYKVHDGRFANNAWLQEMPDPMTCLTWDNVLTLGPETAGPLGIQSGDVVEIQCAERRVEAPALVLPGHAHGSVSITLGYGRTHCGRIGDGVGVNPYPLRTSGAMHFASARIRPAGRRRPLAEPWTKRPALDDLSSQDFASAEAQKRLGNIVREGDLSEFLKDPHFVKTRTDEARPQASPPGVQRSAISPQRPESEGFPNLWKPFEYTGRRWAMAIDLTACIGCGACVVACQAENNIPVVGRSEVARGRDMHWIRVDRYFIGQAQSPRVAHHPVPCQHCETAPCEQVCPVAATVHDSEGLNVQVYNRCVGTRYCLNNCPYKVRRFNFFNNHKHLSSLEKMVYNPEVTMRSRGVMEKCSYCLQRINAVKIAAKNERREIRDGEIVPACAQVCPTQAIVFGDLSDPKSRVARLQADPRAYGMLEELNFRPRTRYLAKLRNPSPELQGI